MLSVCRGPKSSKDSLSSEQIDKKNCNYELELVELWKSSGRGTLETFPYEERNSYGTMEIKNQTKPVYAYTNEDLLRVANKTKLVEIQEVDVKALYNKHKNCEVKPCCRARQDLIVCGIKPDDYEEIMAKAREKLRRKYESEPPTIVYKTIDLGTCSLSLIPLKEIWI